MFCSPTGKKYSPLGGRNFAHELFGGVCRSCGNMRYLLCERRSPHPSMRAKPIRASCSVEASALPRRRHLGCIPYLACLFLTNLVAIPNRLVGVAIAATWGDGETGERSGERVQRPPSPPVPLRQAQGAAWSPHTPIPPSEISLQEGENMMQINSVSELEDLLPTDWAYSALQGLAERYGCLLAYPDRTYRGNQALTRYEFATVVNACLEAIGKQIATSTLELNQEDLQAIERLQAAFNATDAPEVASLRQQVDAIEERTELLRQRQFSPTTKLFGQAIFGIQGRTDNEADFFPVDGEKDTKDPSTEINLIANIQVSLLTQLSERSLLLAGFQSGSGSTAPRLTNDTRLAYEGNTDRTLILSDLNYRKLIGNRLAVIIGPAGVNMANVFRGANPVESAGNGPISAFAQRNPIVNIGNGQGGFGFDWQISPRISLQGVYASSDPANSGAAGIFGGEDGETSLGVQLTITPLDAVDLTLNYVNAYSPFGRLGTGVGDDQLTVDSPLQTNGFGATLAWRATPEFTIGSWGGYTNSGIPGQSGDVETLNWMVFLNVQDLFGRGNVGGIYVGQPPKIVSSNLPMGKNIPDLLAGGLGDEGSQPGSTTHVEVFYRWAVSDRVSFTPGLMMIFQPSHTPDSDPIAIGVLRTTFNF